MAPSTLESQIEEPWEERMVRIAVQSERDRCLKIVADVFLHRAPDGKPVIDDISTRIRSGE